MVMMVPVVHMYDLVVLEVGVSLEVEDVVEVGPQVLEGVLGVEDVVEVEVVEGVVGVVVETHMLGCLTESEMFCEVCGNVGRVMLTSSLLVAHHQVLQSL